MGGMEEPSSQQTKSVSRLQPEQEKFQMKMYE